jgi:hypothetical protein
VARVKCRRDCGGDIQKTEERSGGTERGMMDFMVVQSWGLGEAETEAQWADAGREGEREAQAQADDVEEVMKLGGGGGSTFVDEPACEGSLRRSCFAHNTPHHSHRQAGDRAEETAQAQNTLGPAPFLPTSVPTTTLPSLQNHSRHV